MPIYKTNHEKTLNNMTRDEMIKEFSEIHNNLVGYDKFLYQGKDVKGIFKCLVDDHGYYEQRVRDHRIGKTGCEICKFVNRRRNYKSVIKDAKKIHENKYIYENLNIDRVSNKEVLKIKCKKCSNTFEQTIKNHLSGTGCPDCSLTGYKNNKEGIFYYFIIESNDEKFVKIGITNNSIEERYPLSERKNFKDIVLTNFKNGKDASDLERIIKSKYKKYRYKGDKILKNGNTEIFNIDILKYLKNDIENFIEIGNK